MSWLLNPRRLALRYDRTEETVSALLPAAVGLASWPSLDAARPMCFRPSGEPLGPPVRRKQVLRYASR